MEHILSNQAGSSALTPESLQKFIDSCNKMLDENGEPMQAGATISLIDNKSMLILRNWANQHGFSNEEITSTIVQLHNEWVLGQLPEEQRKHAEEYMKKMLIQSFESGMPMLFTKEEENGT